MVMPAAFVVKNFRGVADLLSSWAQTERNRWARQSMVGDAPRWYIPALYQPQIRGLLR